MRTEENQISVEDRVSKKASELKIESGVPLPQQQFANYGGRLYPWARMSDGDSFLIRGKRSRAQSAVRSGADYYSKRGINLTTRYKKVEKDAFRVWVIDPNRAPCKPSVADLPVIEHGIPIFDKPKTEFAQLYECLSPGDSFVVETKKDCEYYCSRLYGVARSRGCRAKLAYRRIGDGPQHRIWLKSVERKADGSEI